MKDSSNLHLSALRSRLQSDGYILLRNVIDSKLIDDALHIVAENLNETWSCIQIDDEQHKLIDDLHIKGKSEGVLLTGYRPITHHHSVQSLLHCDALITLMHSLFDDEPMTYDTKWVRVKGTGENTEEHSDYFRFAENAENMVTIWTPLMDIPIDKGPLAVCPGSHLLIDGGDESVEYGDYKQSELPSDFETFHESTGWKTTHFKKGDILIFDIRTVHASLGNHTTQFRVSIDTRWQPKRAVTMMGDAFVRFERYLNKEVNGKEDGNGNERDMIMDCSISESDDMEVMDQMKPINEHHDALQLSTKHNQIRTQTEFV